MKIYIAGKITGDKFYKRKFARAERTLKRKGHSVMSPAVLKDYPEFTWNDYMAITRAMQKRCSAILLLSDWKDSKGATEEYKYAKKLHQAVYFSIDAVKSNKK